MVNWGGIALTMLWEGNVLTGVCLFTGGEMYHGIGHIVGSHQDRSSRVPPRTSDLGTPPLLVTSNGMVITGDLSVQTFSGRVHLEGHLVVATETDPCTYGFQTKFGNC